MQRIFLNGIGHLAFRPIPGPLNDPVLVFLHEGLGCIPMWRDFPDRLCDLLGLPGLVYDRLGHGDSDAATATRDQRYQHWHADVELPAVLETLIPQCHYLLIGHSDGGTISLIHAARQPERLLGVVTEAAHVMVEEVTLDGIQSAREAFAAGKLRGLARFHGDKTDSLFRSWAETWLQPEFRFWQILDLLPEVHCPVLALQGEKDQYGSVLQLERIVQGVAGRGELLLLPGCGHSPHLEAPDAAMAAMEKFLRPLL